MGSLAFDSDVPLSYGSMDEDESSFGATASESAAAEDGASQPPPAEPAVEPPADATTPRSSRSRPRGSRGSRSSRPSGGAQRQSERKWRSGAIPQAPVFEGDVEADPYCLRHYKKRLNRWCLITKDFLPAREQALRAREQLRGEAELELAELDDSRYNVDNGIEVLLGDLEESFGERPLFRQGGAIREFESIGRIQGESITAFVRKFRLLERRLRDNQVPEYPEASRVIKLLDGLRLDERSTSALLLAAGNQYKMRAVLDAIKIQYPAGVSITGLPHKRGAAASFKRGQKPGRGRKAWHTTVDEDANEYDDTEMHEYEAWQADYATVAEPEAEYDDVAYDEEDADYQADETEAAGDGAEAAPQDVSANNLAAVVEALTVTSKRLAELTKSRGYYQDKGKGKSGGGGKSNKGKGKGKSKDGKGKSKGKGKGKPSPLPNKGNLAHQKKALDESLCLGCLSPGHWLRDCPHSNTYTAQLTTAGSVLDAEGNMVDHSSWMVTCTPAVSDHAVAEEKEHFVTADDGLQNFFMAPEYDMFSESHAVVNTMAALDSIQVFDTMAVSDPIAAFVDEPVFVGDIASQNILMVTNDQGIPNDFEDVAVTYPLYGNPQILLQNVSKVEGGIMIADTGCQRQVAGKRWHMVQQKNIQPLQAVPFEDACHFSFGPHEGTPATARFAYPAGLGGAAVTLGVSQVDVDAPALFSRPAFETLGAIPDICQGVMYYQALQCTSKLFLAFGHLAIRVDEWPDTSFTWPMQFERNQIPDVWIPQSSEATVLKAVKLQPARDPIRKPPHADDHEPSRMAEQLEVSHDQLPGDPLQCEADGLGVCGHVPETSHEGCHAGRVLSTPDRGDNVEDHHGGSDAEEPPAGIPQRSSSMRPCSWTSKLWRWGQDHQDMRPMWGPLDGEHRQGQVADPLHSQGITFSKDTLGLAEGNSQDRLRPSPRRSGATSTSTSATRGQPCKPSSQSDYKDKPINGAVKGVSKFLGWLATLAVAFNESGQAQDQACSSHVSQTDRAELAGAAGGGRCEHGELGSTKGTQYGLLTQHDGARTRAVSSPERVHMAEPASKPTARGTLGGGIDAGRTGRTSVADTPHSYDRRGGGFQRGPRGRGRSLDGLRHHAKVCQHDGDQPHSAEHQQEPLGPNALRGSADEPLLKEDRGWQQLRSGHQKRLLGTIRSLHKCLTVEANLYGQQAARARAMRRHRCDLLEVYGGFANISIEGIKHGLKVAQPIDKVHGVAIETRADHEQLRQLLRRHRPFLTVWEIRCDPWSHIQHLNYTAEQLEELRRQHLLDLEEMAKTICELYELGCHFLLENPWGTEFWKQLALQLILRLPGVELKRGSMCNFGLRGHDGYLLKKDTGWCSDLPMVLAAVAVPCPGLHEHEECLGTNAKRAQVYTKKLARAVVGALLQELQLRGDERFCKHVESYAQWTTSMTPSTLISSTTFSTLTTSSSSLTSPSTLTLPSTFTSSSTLTTLSSWMSTTECSVWFADIRQDVEAWRPLLKEAADRLHNKVQTAATVKEDTAFHEQVQQLVPWKMKLVQIARAPKVRRLFLCS